MANSGPHTPLSPTQLFDFRDDTCTDDDGALEPTCSPGVPPLAQLPEYPGDDNNHRDGDDAASTQMPSSLFSNERLEDDGKNNDTVSIANLERCDDGDVSTASDLSDDETYCKIDLRHRRGVVTWEDVNYQDQHTSDLYIDLYVDITKQQAIFALRGFFFFKSGGPKAYLSLLIYPEKIQSIEFAHNRPHNLTAPVSAMNDVPDDSFVSLRFAMTQPPSLLVPKDRLFEPKPRYQAVVDSVTSIGSVKQFTIYLSDISPDVQQELALIPSIFSSSYPFGRLQADEKWAAPNDIYEYTFSHVIDLGQTAFDSNPGAKKLEELEELVVDEDAVAPPYSPGDSQRTVQSIGPSSRKRRASEPLIFYTTEKHSDAGSIILGYETPGNGSHPSDTKSVGVASPAHLSAPSDCKRQRTTELLSPVTDVDIIFTLRQILAHNASLSSRIEQLETRLGNCSSRLESLATELVAAADRTPCRYDTEEVENVFSQIDHRIEDGIHDVRHELEETIKLEAEERVAEEVKLQHEELREKLEVDWTEDVRRTIVQEIASEVEEKTTKEVLKGITNALVNAYRASQANQDRRPGFGNSTTPSHPPATTLPGEAALREAVQDIQSKYQDELTGEEMIGVLDLLEHSPLTAAKYNACGEETRRAYVMKWKVDISGRGVSRRTLYR
ncbi:hypothetical protein QBC32DRAFT_355320 [Pseudoneurospora amorphoporcata]|uniref:Uncharacterized protein n=1 Tax=Pseudoneurospora amorphoporcata TaxID=241081 RepID=A0AAN6SB38_9PEZI|nr:hypothetical protein QBC32DRAFT_355320 [Pseudoneurospora amorphoporcata]